MSAENTISQEIFIKDRKNITLDGVISIESFNDDYLVLKTHGATLSIEGEGLRIDSLNKEDGKINVTGRINGVFYSDGAAKQGLFKRLFG